MAEFEKDFIMRQTKDMAKALAKFTESNVDDLLQLDEKQAEQTEESQEMSGIKRAEELESLKKEVPSRRRTEILEEE